MEKTRQYSAVKDLFIILLELGSVSALLGWIVYVAIRRQSIWIRGSRVSRAEQPALYWFAFSIVALAGTFCLAVVFVSLLSVFGVIH